MTGRYGDLIRKAREEEDKIDTPENQDSGKLENQKDGKPEKKKTRKQENQPELVESPPPQPPEPDVNLSIKVPASWRRHWVSEAKRQGTSLTAIIIESLTAKFGKPE